MLAALCGLHGMFPISRDPPEGGTYNKRWCTRPEQVVKCFQFLGIPPKGEPQLTYVTSAESYQRFQFLGIPPKGEHYQ